MHRLISHSTVIACLCLIPAVASAQRRVPAAESGAVIGDIGAFVPRSDELDSSLVLEGFYEYYLTPRGSVRMGLGWTDPSYKRGSDDSLRIVRVALDGVYNWERGAIHPFVGAGVGIYFLQRTDNGEDFGDSETKPGATLFGGAEFFTGRTVSVKAEGKYHLMGDVFGLNPGGLALTIGLKKYF